MSQQSNSSPSSSRITAEITILRTRLSSTHQMRDSLNKSVKELRTKQISDSSDLSTLLFQINECQAEADDVAAARYHSNNTMCSSKVVDREVDREYDYLVETIKTMNWVRERCLREYEELRAKIERMERENERLEREIWELATMLNNRMTTSSWGSLDAGRTFDSLI